MLQYRELALVDRNGQFGADNHELEEGFGSYTVGGDRIEFGSGNGSGPLQPVSMDPGERYTYLGGSLVPAGVRVCITGRAPIRYVLKLTARAPVPRRP